MERRKLFDDKKAHSERIYTSLNKKYNTIAAFRIAVFLIALILVVVFANYRFGVGIAGVVLLFPVIFGLIVKYHNRIVSKRDMAYAISKINREELDRLDNNLKDLDEGAEYCDKKHYYLHDLDIFGHNSVFQLISRAVTPSGRDTLAAWLKAPAHLEEIQKRQEAVKELTLMIEWRQSFQASGMQKDQEEVSIQPLLGWINEPNRVLGKTSYRIVRYLLPAITICLIYLNIAHSVSVYWTVGILVLNGIILKKFASYVENMTEKTFKSIVTLRSYGRMIHYIESVSFQCDYLQGLQSAFLHNNQKASSSILKLQKTLDYLQARSNMFYLFFNFILLFDLHLVIKAEKWKLNQKSDVNHWFENIGKLEALSSLAGLSFANPEFAYPLIVKEPYLLKAEEMAHPLIPKSERVSNNIEMQGQSTLSIITGSNMSGKSTFLRTVGVNIVLALTGGPVCAREFAVSRMQVFTSMRTEDNLEEHVSSFYAELRRIKLLLEMLEHPDIPVMFMLDEILKGTNSKDRHAGAAALIRQVSEAHAMGFVSTHDLELGQLSNELSNVKNYSFNSKIKGDEIIFYYKLEEGVCYSFNASKLMEKIGIRMS